MKKSLMVSTSSVLDCKNLKTSLQRLAPLTSPLILVRCQCRKPYLVVHVDHNYHTVLNAEVIRFRKVPCQGKRMHN